MPLLLQFYAVKCASAYVYVYLSSLFSEVHVPFDAFPYETQLLLVYILYILSFARDTSIKYIVYKCIQVCVRTYAYVYPFLRGRGFWRKKSPFTYISTDRAGRRRRRGGVRVLATRGGNGLVYDTVITSKGLYGGVEASGSPESATVWTRVEREGSKGTAATVSGVGAVWCVQRTTTRRWRSGKSRFWGSNWWMKVGRLKLWRAEAIGIQGP